MAVDTPIDADPSGVPDQLAEALGTDFFSVQDRFSPPQWERFMAVRRFVDHEVLPAAPAAWDAAEMSWDLIRQAADLGIIGDDIDGHGGAGLDPLTSGLVNMELARGDGSLAAHRQHPVRRPGSRGLGRRRHGRSWWRWRP